MNNDMILIHHGIKGQKWGVRRYENPDGSLTPAGKKRYDKYHTSDGKLNEKGLKKFGDEDLFRMSRSDRIKAARKKAMRLDARVTKATQKLVDKKGSKVDDLLEIDKLNSERSKYARIGRHSTTGEMIGKLTVAAISMTPALVRMYKRGQAYLQANNLMVDEYAKYHGLKEYSGGFTPGFQAVNNGRRLINAVMNGG